MKRLLMLVLLALSLAAVSFAGAPCPSLAQLRCGSACDVKAGTCFHRCQNVEWAETEDCRDQCDYELTTCYNGCAVTGGCAPY